MNNLTKSIKKPLGAVYAHGLWADNGMTYGFAHRVGNEFELVILEYRKFPINGKNEKYVEDELIRKLNKGRHREINELPQELEDRFLGISAKEKKKNLANFKKRVGVWIKRFATHFPK